MAYSDIVNVVITSTSVGVTQRSFGIPQVIGYHTNWMDTYRVYSLGTISADLIADGFTVYDPIYRACTAIGRNTPKTKQVVVGRLLTAFDQTFELTVKAAAAEEDRVLAFNVISPAGATTSISYTVQSGDTTTDIATAVAALITAITDITSTSALAVISCAADNSGEMWYLDSLDIDMFDFVETTADSNLVTEESTIYTAYSDTYGLLLADPNSNARVTALAAAIETQERVLGYTTHDTLVGDGTSTTDVFYTLNAASYYQTYGIYSTDQDAYAAACWMGSVFPIAPGATTWAYKTLPGVTADSLSTTFKAAVEAKSGNYYDSDLGTVDGKMAAGEWIDIIRGRDWTTARLRTRIGTLIKSASEAGRKIPFNQKGADAVGKEVQAQMNEGVAATYFTDDPEPIVTVPDVNDTSQITDINRQARTLPGVSFEARLAGAIQIVDPLNGIISV